MRLPRWPPQFPSRREASSALGLNFRPQAVIGSSWQG